MEFETRAGRHLRIAFSCLALVFLMAGWNASHVRAETPAEHAEAGHDHDHGDEEEANPEFETFQKAGFSLFEWSRDESHWKRIYENIVLPDYIARTKKPEPKFPSFDYSLQNVTGGNYNDVIVWSRLPGDCNERGCMAAVFHLVGEKWNLVARFQAIGVMHRFGPTWDRTPELISVGDATNPSILFRWNGETFVEAR